MDIEKEVLQIKERNRKVEEDKAWETSYTRKFLVMLLTYIVIVVFFYSTGLPDPFVNAIVPAIAFVLSTFSISWFKKIWLRNR